MKEYKLAIITYTKEGGAGIAVKRLYNSLKNKSINVDLFDMDDYDDYHSSLSLSLENYTFTNQVKDSTFFSFGYSSMENERLKEIISMYDIINIHWVSKTISIKNLAYLFHCGKPVIWTFHDKNPLTGGCHYFHGCEKWLNECENCPQIIDNLNNYPSSILNFKKKYFNSRNLSLIVLNEHFKLLIEKSPLYNNSKIYKISNGIDTNKFNIRNIDGFLDEYKIPKNKKLLLYIAAYSSSIKGYKEFCEVVKLLSRDYYLLLVGSLPDYREFVQDYTYWGIVGEDVLINLYNCADITILSSIEDNLPNIMLESLSCGTPVIGFDVGGIPDHIINGYNGYYVGNGNIEEMAKKIVTISKNDLSENCRSYAIQNFSLEVMATNYIRVIEEILDVEIADDNDIKIDLNSINEKSLILLERALVQIQKNQKEIINNFHNDTWYAFGKKNTREKIIYILNRVFKKDYLKKKIL